MKKILFGLTAFIAMNAAAQNAGDLKRTPNDSIKLLQLQGVTVDGVRSRTTGTPHVYLSEKTLSNFSNSGQELPFLFARTPGVLAWSENGLGTGTTYMRIRGAGDSRINVTIDGVPLNSPEDQCVFWANMNSYASLLNSVEIQRGVGSSTNGDGAFGGAISLQTKAPSRKAGGELSASYGAYNTYNLGGNFSTGLLWNHLIFDGAYHETNTDGFIHGTDGRSGSYYGGLTWLGNDFMIRYKNIGNFEKTGQAWNAVTAGDNDYSIMDGCLDDGSWSYNLPTGIKTYEDLYNAGLGRYNTLYETLTYGSNGNLFEKDANGNYVTHRWEMADGSYWPRTTDNFWQNHNILSLSLQLSDKWSASASLHYTHGYGYYNEFRYHKKAGEKFGLSTNTKTDFVRKKGLEQDAYGLVGHLRYNDNRWNVVGGLSVQQFNGNHFGYITYIKDEALRTQYLANGDHKYYDSDAKKFDGSVYVKGDYQLTNDWAADEWYLTGDVQYRRVNYKTDGINDRFVQGTDGLWHNQTLDIDEKYNFVNPKVGIKWHYSPFKKFIDMYSHTAFATVAISHREPERNNFTDNYKYPNPKAEQVIDYELGYSYKAPNFYFDATLYYMDFKDQLVQTGELSDIGEKLTTNIAKSYRAGIELSAGWNICKLLSVEGNAALSQNKIKDFDEKVEKDWTKNAATFHYDNSTLAYSPSAILNGMIHFNYKGFQATWHTNYVSRQYLDNTENKDRSLPAFSFSDLKLTYTSKVTKVSPLHEVVLGLQFNNLFDAHYATSGWVYSAILSDTHPNENRYYQIGFVPMAGRTAMANLTLKF
ncbi:TonB-dependent receptor [Prevotella communis]|uniref:TonB-dependent receptor n=1 Tax=Prevotella communis TaxID=2913614 RepID=UPI003D69545D